MVFAADGAGNFQESSKHVRGVVEQERAPVQVVTYEWSHGYLRIVADQVGYAHARAEGCQLARAVEQFRHDHPGSPVFLMGHSAGAAVVLAALENLPPDTVDRAILLSPSLSIQYDLRPALRAVKKGLYVFHSPRDCLYLGLATGILGNSDRYWGPSGGRYGFTASPSSPEDHALLSKLYQRSWTPADRATGNHGDHYGHYQPEFVRQHVLPLIAADLSSSLWRSVATTWIFRVFLRWMRLCLSLLTKRFRSWVKGCGRRTRRGRREWY